MLTEEAGGLKSRFRVAARGLALTALGSLVHLPQGPFLRPVFFHGIEEYEVGKFSSIIERLKRIGEFVDTATLIAMIEGAKPIDRKYFHLSFDDGFFRSAVPALRRLGIPALMFVVTAAIRPDNTDEFTWDELKSLHSWGFEIGSHTRTHPRLAEVSDPDKLRDEILGSKHDIENHLDAECKYIAWPFGRKTDVG